MRACRWRKPLVVKMPARLRLFSCRRNIDPAVSMQCWLIGTYWRRRRQRYLDVIYASTDVHSCTCSPEFTLNPGSSGVSTCMRSASTTTFHNTKETRGSFLSNVLCVNQVKSASLPWFAFLWKLWSNLLPNLWKGLALTCGSHKQVEFLKSTALLGSITSVDRSRVCDLQNPEEDRPLAPHWRVPFLNMAITLCSLFPRVFTCKFVAFWGSAEGNWCHPNCAAKAPWRFAVEWLAPHLGNRRATQPVLGRSY